MDEPGTINTAHYGKVIMGRKKDRVAGKVISVRVTDDELELLQEIMRKTQKSTSNVMRDAIRLFLAPAQ